MKKRIENAMKKLNIERKDVYTVGEMNQIANEAKCDLYRVMYYLRFGK